MINFSNHLRGYHESFYIIGRQALARLGHSSHIDTDTSSPAYRAFTGGFAALEAASRAVSSDMKPPDLNTDTLNIQLLVSKGNAAYHHMADIYQAFPETHPNTWSMLVNSAPLPSSLDRANQPPSRWRSSKRNYLPSLSQQRLENAIIKYRLMGACFALMLEDSKNKAPDDISSLFE